MKWNENLIAGALARQLFNRRALVVVPKCGWTGDECDLLVVMPDLRLVDVEVKTSWADLRADAKKLKWFHHWDWKIDGPYKIQRGENGRIRRLVDRRPREWPRKVWKHYYAFPEKLWKAGVMDGMPAASGVLLIRENAGHLYIRCARRAKPCRQAEKISVEDAVDIARLASLRMWDAYAKLEKEGASMTFNPTPFDDEMAGLHIEPPEDESPLKSRDQRLHELQSRYNELLFHVGKKYPNETRHETALKYIKKAEAVHDNTPKQARKERE